jgi:streptogramin lyase
MTNLQRRLQKLELQPCIRKKGFAVANSGDVFVAVMGSPNQGWIARREVSGKETFFPVEGMPIWIAAGPDGNIYVPRAATATVVVYRPDGIIAREIPHNIKDSSVCDILVDKDGVIYLASFHTGKVLRIGFSGSLWRAEFLSPTFGTPGGIAMDSHGRLYVSDFAGNSIDVVY